MPAQEELDAALNDPGIFSMFVLKRSRQEAIEKRFVKVAEASGKGTNEGGTTLNEGKRHLAKARTRSEGG